MSDKQGAPSANLFAIWRDWFLSSEGRWNEMLNEFLKDERVAQTLGSEMQQAVFLQKMSEEVMQRYLAGVNLPSRLDVEKLGERLGKVEDGLARLQEEMVKMRTALVDAGAVPADAALGMSRPRRTRKPGAESGES